MFLKPSFVNKGGISRVAPRSNREDRVLGTGSTLSVHVLGKVDINGQFLLKNGRSSIGLEAGPAPV